MTDCALSQTVVQCALYVIYPAITNYHPSCYDPLSETLRKIDRSVPRDRYQLRESLCPVLTTDVIWTPISPVSTARLEDTRIR